MVFLTRTSFAPFTDALPKKPKRRKEEFVFSLGKSSLGPILVALSELGIASILLDDKAEKLPERLHNHFPKVQMRKDDKAVKAALAEVLRFIEKPTAQQRLPLDIRGTVFQRKVWTAVRGIPAGSTATYSEIAEKVGAPRAVRAVGTTCTKNPLAFAIPCHRVVRKGESLASGISGSKRKRMLLSWDQKIKPTKPSV